MTLVDAHRAVAWVLIVSNALVGVWATAAQYVPALRVRPIWYCIVFAQLTTFVMAIIGVLIVQVDDVELDSFHALYGFSAIIAVAILYSYRTSPFVKDRVWLLYGLGSLFIMGLGIRAFSIAPRLF